MAQCRYCGDALMSESTVCVTCYKERYRKCDCSESEVCGITPTGQRRYRKVPNKKCQKCHGKGYWLDESPVADTGNRRRKTANGRNAANAGTLAGVTNTGTDSATVTNASDTVGNG